MLLRIGRYVGTFDHCGFILILKCTDDSGLSFVISWWSEICSAVTSAMWKWTQSPWDRRLLWLCNLSSASASLLPEVLLQAVHQWASGGIWPLSCVFLSYYNYRNHCVQSTCSRRVSVDCITYRARSLHFAVAWAQPESNYSVEKIAVQNVSSF